MTVAGSDQITFDAGFLAKLRERDPATSTQFIFYFSPILEAKLRYEFRDHGLVEDVRNETLCRVMVLVDRGQVRAPESFGSFVRGVCAKVVQEHRRRGYGAVLPVDDSEADQPDTRPLIETLLAQEELRKILRVELTRLSLADQDLIKESYFQQRDRQDMARDRGITQGGLNVRLCRALKFLRVRVLKGAGLAK